MAVTQKIRALIFRHREFILYGVFGVMTTVVNYVIYNVWVAAFPGKYANVTATSVAFVIAVIFAYFTNGKWVFESKAAGLIPRLTEFAKFFAARLFSSGLLDLGIMYFFVDVLDYNGKIVKLASNVLVILINYFLSKFIVFRKKTRTKTDNIT